MTDILEEVLNDHAYERRIMIFKKILPIIILVSVTAIIAMLVIGWYQDKRNKNNQDMSYLLIRNIFDNYQLEATTNNSETISYIIDNAKYNVAELAHLRLAIDKIEQKDFEGTKAILLEITKNDKYTDITKAYARLSFIGLIINQNNISTQEKNILIEYFNYFTHNPNLFGGNATLLEALWYVRNNEISKAKTLLEQLQKIADIHPFIKEQASSLIENIENN